MAGGRPSSGGWRTQWVAFCVVWAGLWFIAGFFFWPFWVMVPVSLLAILLPVGSTR